MRFWGGSHGTNSYRCDLPADRPRAHRADASPGAGAGPRHGCETTRRGGLAPLLGPQPLFCTPNKRLGEAAMSVLWLISLGVVSGAAAGLLAGLIGIGGGIVIVPVMYYGLVSAGASADQAAHIAVATSLAAILPAALASSFSHWRAGNTDLTLSARMGSRHRDRRCRRAARGAASPWQRPDRGVRSVHADGSGALRRADPFPADC